MADPQPLIENVRQLLAVLEGERQALATLDLDRILLCADTKQTMCAQLSDHSGSDLDEECLGLLSAIKQLNALNRRMRNTIAANIEGRLTRLTGVKASTYATRVNHGPAG